MRRFIGIIAFAVLTAACLGFFVPLTNEERVKQSHVIALGTVAETPEGDFASYRVESVIKGPPSERLKIFVRHEFEGRDPYLKKGRYLVFLAKDPEGRWCTVQSSLDAFPIEQGMVLGWKEKGATARNATPLPEVLDQLQKLLAQQGKAE